MLASAKLPISNEITDHLAHDVLSGLINDNLPIKGQSEFSYFEFFKKVTIPTKSIAIQSKLQLIGMLVQKLLHSHKFDIKKVRNLSPTPRRSNVAPQLRGIFYARKERSEANFTSVPFAPLVNERDNRAKAKVTAEEERLNVVLTKVCEERCFTENKISKKYKKVAQVKACAYICKKLLAHYDTNKRRLSGNSRSNPQANYRNAGPEITQR